MAKRIKGRPGAPCLTCQHPKRREIDARLARRAESGESISAIGRAYGLKRDALTNHETLHLPGPLAVVAARHAELREETESMDVIATLNRCADRADRMLAAADAWLRDPNDPDKYNLNPRTHEVEIVYEREVGDRTVRETRKLRDLMEAVESGLGVSVVRGETKVADPRKLLLDAVATLKPVAELLGKASGALKVDGPAVMVNLMQHPDMQRIAEMHEALVRKYPEAGAWLAQQMRESAGAIDVKAIGGGRR